MKFLVLYIVIFLSASISSFANERSQFLNIGSLQVHYGVFSPQTSPIGDVLFLHGYGDTFINHSALFSQLNSAGLRVVSFDYPSHGKTQGEIWDDLNEHSFASLTEIASEILKSQIVIRPLFIIGWSTGGLHAIRIAQVPSWRRLFPTLKGLVLYAPGVAVKKCVGDRFCQITNETLSHDRSLANRDIHPKSPLYRLDFAAKIILSAWQSWQQAIPVDIPVLVFVGSHNDSYVKTDKIKSWVRLQRNSFSSNIKAAQCSEARHELDNEPEEYGGQFVRDQSSLFLKLLVDHRAFETLLVKGPCQWF